MEEEVSGKRGRGRGRRGRARGRGGRGRGKRAAVVVSSDEDASLDQQSLEEETIAAGQVSVGLNVESTEDQPMNDLSKDNESDVVVPAVSTEETSEQQRQATAVIPQTIDMEADISQLEAPTFTTISRGPPEPMLRLKWNHKVNLIGEKVLNPMIHCCDQCDKPILLYGRMIPCKHVFCLKCARAEPIKICPRCNDMVLRVEQSGLGTVFMCTHGGSRYGNTGCRRTYLSQRDLQAHINHRHVTQPPPLSLSSMPATAGELKAEVNLEVLKGVGPQRKLSESSATPTTPSSLLPQRQRSTGIGSIPPPGAVNTTCSTLTQANIARINSANEQQQHSSKVALHQTLKKTGISQSHHQPPETVADASYYSSVLNSFGSGAGGTGSGSNGNGGSGGGGAGGGDANAVAGSQSGNTAQQSGWSQNQYYR